MTSLDIVGSQSTPSIQASTETGVLEMRGDSYPENSFELFKPVFDWVEYFIAKESQPLQVKLYLLYLNTSSIKALMDIFDMLETAHRAGRQVSVRWFYDQQNERVAELAEEFKEDCTFPFEVVTE